MGMFDTYKPAQNQRCPVCGNELREWQGKDGPCALLVWAEGVAEPISQDAGDMNISEAERRKIRLPDVFEIYTYDCNCPFPVSAICESKNGVWVKTKVVDLSRAKQGKTERKEDFKKRLRWLEGKAT